MPKADKGTVFLIDGHALVYRAFYAMISRPLRTSRGENTSAPWGIVQFIRKVLAERNPDYLGFIFDAGGEETFRHDLYEDYKATREKLDETLQEDFDTAMRRIRQILEGFDIPIIELEGYEADDVIGTLARQATEQGLQAVIVSGDKDFYQLIDGGVALLNPGRGGPAAVEEELVDESNAAERLGVPPDRVTDYLALVGDSSDNIPGVRGIGPKTAAKLIQQYGSLEEILAHADEVKGKRPREALQEHAEEARLSKELVTIRKDVPVQLRLDDLQVGWPDRERLRDLFLELEFHSLVREYAEEEPPPEAAEAEEATGYETITDAARVADLAEEARGAGRLALDVRTATRYGGPPVGLAIAIEPGRAQYLPLAHAAARDGELALDDSREADAGNLPPLADPDMRPLAQLLADDGVTLIGHDLKRALLALEADGIELEGPRRDVMIESYCLDPGRRQHDLETLVLEEFGRKLTGYEEVCGKGKSEISFSAVPIDRAAAFAAERADSTLRIDERLTRQLDDFGLRKLFDEIEMPLMPVLADMERAGIAIDRDFFAGMAVRIDRELKLVEEEIYKLAGREFNINSPLQLREILFDQLELPVKKRTKTGPSTDAEVLEALAAEGHDIPRLLLEFRELAKLKSTYVDALPLIADPKTNRIHSSFNQTVTSTGRLSSSEPNLQNIPIRTVLGAEIRKGFVAGAGKLLLGADYSQIELRILAHLSGDPAFTEAFNAGRDVHRDTAALIFGVKSDAVTPAMRGQAKTVNFATIYGQGPMALARQLGITVKEAREFIESYFQRFPAIREYLQRQVETARDQGYVETLFGRRRYIPELNSKNPNIRGFGERVATNSPIQGTAADLIKLAMIRIHQQLRERESGARMILQVHDELLFELAEDELEEVTALVKKEMEGALELSVPIAVDMGVGHNWYETKSG
ncbi:MAG: DNA polymerase I [Gemmatimonadetes bacterium]|uniref:DNA polymerase I n=1 Tax=Candidatus Kutchimonas denitrificans TaxID=3056748 RepID=A0AAE4Z6K4_9BACT|nr:DNA polymerase I [Gemmatimonadota bacterium]NIR73662.1 DNA polymerase I [Candidatus Kutchimonas denitrificans]NIS00712.1 DNA polymerase I [Gemmatimonadota bacterium]NIT66299.1 DNA polymerase I [Gemmatimonadota bacterium]NIU51517.1 DNA polymerase I [Gemmatimonadota bacterium]